MIAVAEPAFVLALSVATLWPSIEQTKFHGDESQWIATSRYFESFVRGDMSASTWETSYWTLTQPPVTRYLIGIGRRLGGLQLADLNVPWRWGTSDKENEALGAMPSPRLLWWSRAPMMVLGALAALLLFSIARDCAGRIGAYVFLGLFLGNNLIVQSVSRAMGEAPLLAALAAAFWAALQALRSWSRPMTRSSLRRVRLWFLLSGVLVGIAGSAKLNGLAALGSVAALATVAASARRADLSQLTAWKFAAWTSALACIAGLGVFFALNPFLYRAPSHLALMAAHRVDEMHRQEGAWPQFHIVGIGSRMRILPAHLLYDYSALKFPGAPVLYLACALLGVWVLWQGATSWWRSTQPRAGPLVVLIFAVTTAGPALLTPLDWGRYFLLPVVFVMLCSATGVAAAVTWLYSATALRFWTESRSPHPARRRQKKGGSSGERSASVFR